MVLGLSTVPGPHHGLRWQGRLFTLGCSSLSSCLQFFLTPSCIHHSDSLSLTFLQHLGDNLSDACTSGCPLLNLCRVPANRNCFSLFVNTFHSTFHCCSSPKQSLQSWLTYVSNIWLLAICPALSSLGPEQQAWRYISILCHLWHHLSGPPQHHILCLLWVIILRTFAAFLLLSDLTRLSPPQQFPLQLITYIYWTQSNPFQRLKIPPPNWC